LKKRSKKLLFILVRWAVAEAGAADIAAGRYTTVATPEDAIIPSDIRQPFANPCG